MKREAQVQGTFKAYPNDKKEILRLRKMAGLTWPSFIKYINRLVKEDLNKKQAKKFVSDLNKLNREEN